MSLVDDQTLRRIRHLADLLERLRDSAATEQALGSSCHLATWVTLHLWARACLRCVNISGQDGACTACMYQVKRGQTLVIMLGGGDKSTPSKDIRQAIELAQQLED